MAKRLILISGRYLTRGSAQSVEGAWGVSSAKKGVGCSWFIMEKQPNVIIGLAITQGYVRAGVAHNFEIPAKEIAQISTCEAMKPGKMTAVQIVMKSGNIHILDMKKDKKAEDTSTKLLGLLQPYMQA